MAHSQQSSENVKIKSKQNKWRQKFLKRREKIHIRLYINVVIKYKSLKCLTLIFKFNKAI